MSATGRLAPSPTGHLHLGHARSFLLAYWQARSQGACLRLRLEDLDLERVKPGALEATLEDLRWLGIDWDGEPWIQSEHRDAIDAAAFRLLAEGRAYPCVCTRREIEEAASAPQAGMASGRYPGTCRGRWRTLEEARAETGREPALRLCVPPGSLRLHDEFRGDFEVDVDAEVGDFPIRTRSGAPAYQLAVVVDDARMGVEEIVRGDDLLSSAARQYLLQQALTLPHPRWWHVPLVCDEHGNRLAKRTDALSLRELAARGVTAPRIVGWVARRSGWPELGTQARVAELSASFDMRRVPRGPLVCGPEEWGELLS
jgi:glutamyl-tRNA synthetase